MIADFFKKYGWRYIPGFFLMIACSYIQTRAPIALGAAVALWRPAVGAVVLIAGVFAALWAGTKIIQKAL